MWWVTQGACSALQSCDLWNLLEDFRVEILYSSIALFPYLFNWICKRRYWNHSHETRIICTSETFGLWIANDPHEVFAWRYKYRRWRKLQDILFPGRDSNHVLLECQIDALPNRTPQIERGDRVIRISVYKSGSPGFKFRSRHGCPELGGFVVFLRSTRQMPESVSQTGPRPFVSISFLLYLFTDRSVIRRVRPNSERLVFREMNC